MILSFKALPDNWITDQVAGESMPTMEGRVGFADIALRRDIWAVANDLHGL